MLQNARTVEQTPEVIQPQHRKRESALIERPHGVASGSATALRLAGPVERFQITISNPAPGHLPPREIGPLAHRVAADFVPQQSDQLARQRRAVAERHQDAASLGQQLLRVPIRRRDHRLAAAEGIGERPGHNLGRVQIRRDVNIRDPQKLLELIQADEAIAKHDVLAEVQLLDQPLQAQPIGLALFPQQIGMGCTQHDVNHVRTRADDLGQRSNHVFYSLHR